MVTPGVAPASSAEPLLPQRPVVYRCRAVTLAINVALAALVGLVAGCSSGTGGSATAVTPAAGDLLGASSAAMAAVTSSGFTLAVDGQLPTVTVQTASGSLTAAGDATGTAKIVQFGQLIEVEFVLVGGDLYVKGVTGGFAKVPAALAGNLYDPSAILDPTRGLAKVLSSVRDPVITGSKDGSWVVTGTVPAAVIGGVVPGINTDVGSTLSIAMTGSQLTSGTFTLNGADGKPATVTVDLVDINTPVTISPP